mmetsp:Transcript_25752/g.60128  ORF Transcript_25752/g.60128 Transcript_25752/m.60128 type:complete len:233 (-) Transcript_25752:122-820(-)|eukprot:CAMPEP_0178432334 /NCGR_PEP_ID=MMETSP0689_2-20121128/32327_1 /TAXON_ID=160604 /ORGANISM="Amphidinium massartii, Strain CS-259" /LENGTH=232 /DNA_ID=CAMNT_0020054309 /DNA_START=106 /DNA_END=804 /DNA_ORIENTATION=-
MQPDQNFISAAASCQLHASLKHTFLHFAADDESHAHGSSKLRSHSCPGRFVCTPRQMAAVCTTQQGATATQAAGIALATGAGGCEVQHAGAEWVVENEVTTVQCLGISPWFGMDKLIKVLEENGFRGSYNYIHMPRNNAGEGKGYAFINLTTVSAAANLVATLHGHPLPCAANGRRKVRCAAAKKQGYAACEWQMHKYTRVTNETLRPLVTTLDGSRIIMAPPEAYQVWQQL